MAVTERDWQAKVEHLAELYGWWPFHVRDSRTVTAAGWPDLVLLKPPRVLFLELKTATGRLRPEQVKVLRGLADSGQEVGVFRPTDLPRLLATIGPRQARLTYDHDT